MGGFVSNAVEKPASRHIYAANDRSLVTLTICRNGTDYEGFLSTFAFPSIEAAVVRAGPEAPPATTRGGAV